MKCKKQIERSIVEFATTSQGAEIWIVADTVSDAQPGRFFWLWEGVVDIAKLEFEDEFVETA